MLKWRRLSCLVQTAPVQRSSAHLNLAPWGLVRDKDWAVLNFFDEHISDLKPTKFTDILSSIWSDYNLTQLTPFNGYGHDRFTMLEESISKCFVASFHFSNKNKNPINQATLIAFFPHNLDKNCIQLLKKIQSSWFHWRVSYVSNEDRRLCLHLANVRRSYLQN